MNYSLHSLMIFFFFNIFDFFKNLKVIKLFNDDIKKTKCLKLVKLAMN